MKIVPRVLYIFFLLLSGLMFMRIILDLADVSDERLWALPIFAITSLITTPISFLMFGDAQPTFTLFGTKSMLEPSAVIALFVTLVSAFIVSCVAHAMERKKGTPIIEVPTNPKKSFWD